MVSRKDAGLITLQGSIQCWRVLAQLEGAMAEPQPDTVHNHAAFFSPDSIAQSFSVASFY